MTQKNQANQVESVAEIEEDQIDPGFGAIQRKSGMSPATKLALILGLGGASIVAALMLSGNQIGGGTQVVAPPQLDATPGGVGQAESPEFQEFLRMENERRAALARELGVTSMPVPEIILQPRPPVVTVAETPEIERRSAQEEAVRVVQPTTRRILPSPQGQQVIVPQQVTVPVETEPQVQQTAQGQALPEEPEENPFTTNIVRQMGAITPLMAPMALRSASLESSQGVTSDPNTAAMMGMAGSGVEPEQSLILRPGDILFGETLVSIDSDNDTPALVEIVSGDLRGSRLVGGFTADRRSNSLVVNFTSITLPDGRTTSIEAFAVDARSAQTAVSSDVERRFIRRYAPILASTFISSYAEALSDPGQTIIGTGTDREVISNSRTARQSLFAGLGAATEIIAQDIMQDVPVGPRISLRSGYPVAILVVEPVSLPVQGDNISISPTDLFNSGGQ